MGIDRFYIGLTEAKKGGKIVKKEVGSAEWWGNLVTLLLCGWFMGIDRFYRGQIGWGILKTITLGCLGLWGAIDFFRYWYRFGKTGQWIKSEEEVS